MKNKGELSNILILILVGVFLVAASMLTASDTEDIKAHGVELDRDWTVTINGKLCDDTSMSTLSFPLVDRGDELLLETTLPDITISNPIFVFYSVHSADQVLIDGKEIFSYGMERYAAGQMVGYGYQCINLPEDYKGKTLSVRMFVCEDAAFTSFDVPKLYDANWYVKDYLMENRVPLIINLFLIVFGICMAVTTLVLLVRMRSLQWLRLFWVSLIAFGIGCWSLCSYNLTYMFGDNLLWKTLIEYAALYTVPIPVFAYFHDEVMRAEGKLRRGAYYVIMSAQVLFTLSALILQVSGICHFPKILWIQHLLMAVIALYLVYLFTSDIRHRRFESPVLFVGAITLILFAAADLLRFILQKYVLVTEGKYVGMLCIGVMIFMTSMLLDFSRSIIHTLLEAARGKTLEELAYTDALTGLANKRSCEDAFDALDMQEEEKQYAIGVFDLNNLKKVNDQLGHEEGDAFIKAFGEVLKEIFGQDGLVGRTGGDEFMVILYQTSGEEISRRMEKMNRLMEEKNKEHAGWALSTAYGFCEYKESPDKNAKQIYKIADGRMYECKKIMKQGNVR